MTEALEKIARDAARKVSALLPESSAEDDGAGEYVYLPVECKNPEEYVIAFVPTLEDGATAKWTVQNNEHGWSWDSETLTASSAPEAVVAWIQECVQDCASRVDAPQ